MEFQPFYIGQRVVAVDAMEGSRIKNGQEYTITDCHYSPSGNPIAKGAFFWYVGVNGHHNYLRPAIFAPIQYKDAMMTFNELKAYEKIEVLINN